MLGRRKIRYWLVQWIVGIKRHGGLLFVACLLASAFVIFHSGNISAIELPASAEFYSPQVQPEGRDVLFFPRYNVARGPQGMKQVATAFQVAPRSHRLLEVQQDILSNQRRPPDSAYNLNVSLSDTISLDRDIDDTRPEPCKTKDYDINNLPKASIVIPFYNEALSMLLRTVHSILNRTPDSLLQEVILVDDASTHEHLKEPLDRYAALLPKVRLLRNWKREGLIRSRLLGCNHTTGAVVVFLDAHTEMNTGWLEPLLAALSSNPSAVVQPFVDGIDIDSLQYSKPMTIYRGGFSWDLRFVWIKTPEHLQRQIAQEGTPYWSPTLVGCAIAIFKAHFNALGAFDEDQYIWGGENIELAFRAWLCGGEVITIPCSRVGHVFRPLPYSVDGTWAPAWQKNLMRVADVWLDEFRHYFYSSTRVYKNKRLDYTHKEKISLRKRLRLKQRLNCKPFSWYLTNVVPDIPIPPRDAAYHGEITNYKSQACWTVLDDGYISITYSCYEHKLLTDNIFSLTSDGLLLYKDKCVKFDFPSPALRLYPCPSLPSKEFGIWSAEFHDARWMRIQVKLSHNGKTETWCVVQVTSAVEPHRGTQMPHTGTCDDNNLFQYWSFSYRFDYQDRYTDPERTVT